MHKKTIHSVSVDVGGRPMTFETGWYAKQAYSVVVKQDESSVLVTFVMDRAVRPFDFLPLTVNYEDRTGASGKIPGGFLKREGSPDERGTLICRLIDRPLRPQFPKHLRCELQCMATVLSYDPASDTDVLAMCGASAASLISDAPIEAAVAGVRVCRTEGKFLVNPSRAEMELADLTLIVAGTAEAIAMVEGGANEASEADMLAALDLAHAEIKKICAAIDELRAKAGVEKMVLAPAAKSDAEIAAKVAELGQASLVAALAIRAKHERSDAIKAARNEVIAKLVAGIEDPEKVEFLTNTAKAAWQGMIRKTMRETVTTQGVRIDGRATDEIRDITCEVGVAPRAHGSAVFTRGETQAFVTATLGIEMDAQRIDFAGATDPFRRWMLQYNFAPFCTGEVRRLGGPKRREIGHGALAHRAVEPLIPSQADFPYVLRCVSDVLESNGSSSMATVCGASLAMMDAGVPLRKPVAGIAMGLVREDGNYAVISDILGDEDHLGDMDFKVTGTRDGITAFQMDTKIAGIPSDVMVRAMNKAREGRVHILDEMGKVWRAAAPR